jgi:hypothetical protein
MLRTNNSYNPLNMEESDTFLSATASAPTNAIDLSYSIVWSPLPVVTWFVPFIGHLGICDSRGIASDFRGTFFVGDDGNMAFGSPTRYYKVPNAPLEWDDAIQEANQVYGRRIHNLCCDNCHSHVAMALNTMGWTFQVGANDNYSWTIAKWDMIKLSFLMFVKSKFVSKWAIAAQFGPFILFVLVLWGLHHF